MLADAVVWRIVLSIVVGVLTYWTIAGGTIRYAAGPQVAVVLGLVVGLIAPTPLVAGAVSLAVFALGALAGPHNFLLVGNPAAAPLALLPWSLLAAVVGAGTTYAMSRRSFAPDWLWWLAVAAVVVNMWSTVIVIDRTPIRDISSGIMLPALVDLMQGAEAPQQMKGADDYLYLLTDRKMRSGIGYYEASDQAFRELGFIRPSRIWNLRQPALYVFISSMPNATWVIGAYLALVSVAAVSVRWALRDVVRAPLVLPAVFAVLTYALPSALQSRIYYADSWAGPLVLLAFAFFAHSMQSSRWRLWMGASVAFAVLAFFTREMAGIVLVAGTVGSGLGPAERRRWALGAWGAGSAVAAVGYVAHFMVGRPYLLESGIRTVGMRGGLAFSLSALTDNTLAFGMGVAVALAVLAYLGALSLPDSSRRFFALVVLVIPLVLYLFIGNSARDTLAGTSLNYWGGVVMPLAYACIPAVFALIPGSVPVTRRSQG